MKIALVYPSIYDSGFNTSGRRIVFNQIHPGLCYLSAACKKEGLEDITLIDLRTLTGWDDFRSKAAEIKPDIACVTLMSPDYRYAARCIEIVKEIDPGIKTAVGGYHPTIATDEMAKNADIDYIFVGEGEIAFPSFLKRVEAGKAAERIIRGERMDADALPFIDRELFDCLELPYDFFLPLPFVTILAGRGCPYNCRFCAPASKTMHGFHVRRRSVGNVIEELKSLRDTYGFRSMQFWDDCFSENKDWVMEFCSRYKEEGFVQPFVCQMRADNICKNPDMMKTLKSAGLAMVSIGFESGNDRILKFINKGATLKINLMASRICGSLGIKIWAYHMFGLPTETNDEALDTVRMIRKIRPYRSSAAFFTPHPGSHFYEYCKKEGLSLVDEHDDFARHPEEDSPKIRGIDYNFMREAAAISKRPSSGVRLKIRLERIIAHKANKPFKARLEKEMALNPSLNKMAVLRLARQAGRI